MKNEGDGLFETRLQAALRAQPYAELPSDFAAKMRAKAEATAVPSLFQERFYRAAPAPAVLSRMHVFMAATLFVSSFVAGLVYADVSYIYGAGSSKIIQSEVLGQSGDPLLNSLYYAQQRIL